MAVAAAQTKGWAWREAKAKRSSKGLAALAFHTAMGPPSSHPDVRTDPGVM